MVLRALPRLMLIAVLAGSLLHQVSTSVLAEAGSLSISAPSAHSGKRWVAFGLSDDASGDIQFGQSLELAISVGGVAQGHAPLVAICESVHFERQLVMLEQDPVSMIMKGTALLDPIPSGKLSVIPKVARIQVTFARSQNEKLERVMRRIVYVTLDTQQAVGDLKEPAPSASEDVNAAGEVQEEIQPNVQPMAAGPMAEEDLMPLPAPGQGRAYWQEISSLVSRSWSRAARRVRHSPSSETVRVKFRLYPSGRAQLIQIEKGSGAREIDEAGIFAVVHAQPFPPFPEDVGTEPVDVHVRMRTGAKIGPQEPRSVVNPQQTPR